jgi:hypothetical protein
MSHTRGESRDYDLRERVVLTAEARVVDLDHALATLKDVRRILLREDLDELNVVQRALERLQIGHEALELRLEKAIKGRGAERRREKASR